MVLYAHHPPYIFVGTSQVLKNTKENEGRGRERMINGAMDEGTVQEKAEREREEGVEGKRKQRERERGVEGERK